MPDDYLIPNNSGEGSAEQANYLQNAINTSLPLSGYVPKPTIGSNNEFGFDNNPTGTVGQQSALDAGMGDYGSTGVIGTGTPAEIAAAKASYNAANPTSFQDALKNITGFIQQNKGILSAGALASALSSNNGGGGQSAVGIPSLVANRMQVPGTNDPYRVPGSSGRQYFTDTVYSDPSQQTTAQGLIQAQAQAIAANQPNAPVPSFAMPYNNIRGGITSLPTTQTQIPTTADLASQLQSAYSANNIGAVNNILSSNNLDATALQKLIPTITPGDLTMLASKGVNIPTLPVTPAVIPAVTPVVAPLKTPITPVSPVVPATVATAPVSDQLTKAWAGGTKPDVATINKLITENKLDVTGLQKMFPSIVAGDLQALTTAGVNIPGYTPPATGVASLPAATTATTPAASAGYTPYTQQEIQQYFANPANAGVNVDYVTQQFHADPAAVAAAIQAMAPAPNNAIAQAAQAYTPAAPAPSYNNYSNSDIANYLAANGIDVGNAAQVAAAVQATNADPQAVSNYIASNYSTEAATGGLMGYAHGGKAKQPRYLSGDTDGMADEINTTIDDRERAKLSHGEFVIPADVVSHMGNGNSDAGAKKLYDMMAKIRKARTGNPKQGKQINPDKFTGGIAGYATGGNVKRYSGASPDGSTVSSGTTSGIAGLTNTGGQRSDTLSSYVAPYVTQMLGQGQALANAPMQTYQGPLTAGQSALQNQQFAGLSQMAQTGYNPMDYQSQDFNQEQAQKYMNPYLSASLAPQLSELQRQAQINNTMDASKLTGAGAYGGGRQAVLMGEQNRNLLDKSNQLIGSGYNTAYSNAMSQFNADQARQAAAQQNTEASRQFSANQGIKTLDMLGQAGAAQRDIAQQGISADQAQFQQQQLYPYQQLAFQQSLLGGLPISTAVTTPNAMSDTGNILAALGVVSNPDIAAKLKQLGIG
jgi:hypothetical protein